ncbi:VanZ like family protein [Sphingomonas laterariae]|uniref:VanZ like family protein n=2 Tax=Edaphosphingomonas laterariae TaxID=861865 RepID=A0A239EXK5_9SPHN|nr:VanZ like family protein [Sphingomonas laterariae]
MLLFDRLFKTLFWVALILVYTAAILPPAEAPRITSWDKAEHMIAFFTLAALGGLAWRRVPLWRIAVILAGIGAAIEFTQAIPGLNRDPSSADFVADCVAIVVGLALAALLRARLLRA